MRRRLTIIAALCLGSGPTALAQKNHDTLQQRLLAQVQSVSPEDYAFTRTKRTEQTSGGKTEQRVSIEKFDPTKPVEARWTLVSVDGAPPPADVLKTFRTDSAKRRVSGYSQLADYFGTPATTTTDSRGRTVFHFPVLPKDTVKLMDSDVSQNATADASVSEANGESFVEQVRITVRPMRLKLIMKLDGFESTGRYRMGPEGKPLLIEQTTDFSGSGLGLTGRGHTVTTYSDYRATRKRP